MSFGKNRKRSGVILAGVTTASVAASAVSQNIASANVVTDSIQNLFTSSNRYVRNSAYVGTGIIVVAIAYLCYRLFKSNNVPEKSNDEKEIYQKKFDDFGENEEKNEFITPNIRTESKDKQNNMSPRISLTDNNFIINQSLSTQVKHGQENQSNLEKSATFNLLNSGIITNPENNINNDVIQNSSSFPKKGDQFSIFNLNADEIKKEENDDAEFLSTLNIDNEKEKINNKEMEENLKRLKESEVWKDILKKKEEDRKLSSDFRIFLEQIESLKGLSVKKEINEKKIRYLCYYIDKEGDKIFLEPREEGCDDDSLALAKEILKICLTKDEYENYLRLRQLKKEEKREDLLKEMDFVEI